MQMAVIQEYRSNDSQVLGVALGSVPRDKFASVHAFMKKQLAGRNVPYLGTSPLQMLCMTSFCGNWSRWQRPPRQSAVVCLHPDRYTTQTSQGIFVCKHHIPWVVIVFLPAVQRKLGAHLAQALLCAGTFPVQRELSTVSLDQIYHAVGGKLLFTDLDQVQLGDPVSDVYVVTPNVGVMLQRLLKSDRPLLVTTPDRIDTLTTAVAAHSSGMVPLSGTQPRSWYQSSSVMLWLLPGCTRRAGLLQHVSAVKSASVVAGKGVL